MEFKSQIFKAPSLTKTPKLKKTTFASSTFSGISKSTSIPKVNYGGFAKLLKSKSSGVDLEKISTPTNDDIASTLIETNAILVEIQKQLSYDFAMRIAEEKEKKQIFQKEKSRKRLKAEESQLEKSGKKIGGILKKVVDKTLSPIENIFSKLMNFVLTVGAGIATNAAFEWLSKEENREKLDKWFEWVGKNWKWIAATAVGLLVVKELGPIIGMIGGAIGILKTAFDLFNWARKKIFPKTPSTPKPPPPPSGSQPSMMRGGSNTGLYYGRNVDPLSGRQLRSPGSISRYNASMARDIQGRANIGDKARLSVRNLNPSTLSRAAKFAGPAVAVGSAGFDYKARKDAGQTDVQAAAGAGGGLLGSIAAGALAATLIPEPASTVGGLAVLGLIYGISTLGSIFGSATADKITGVEARAIGGPVSSGSPYLVGERGPELFIPNINGSVVNNYKTEKIYQMISSKKKSRMNFIELPPIVTQNPQSQVSVPTGEATEVPSISSTNSTDPYLQIAPILLGITV